MGKNQLTTKEAQSQGVCEKIFKAMNVSPAFRLFRRISTVNYPQTLTHKSATPTFSTKRIVAQDHNNLSFASNMVHVEYNHSSLNSKAEPLNNFPANIIATTRYHQDPKGAKSAPENKSPIKIKNMANKVQLNEDYNDNTSNDRFSKYIDHVKNKLRTLSSFEDDSGVGREATRRDSFNDKVAHNIDRSKLKIRTTTISGGRQGAA
ncbi:hypothetical protein A4A49_27063 [Nicotiana attenuata]|uniref:Uncharacterized protein n=1 Tax=Nicotiana attenuata TaxID=49451 RepID=A0A314KX63_NICAT|nr:hypothetical protein A4A49_27063 [Nicotiana attenuata]